MDEDIVQRLRKFAGAIRLCSALEPSVATDAADEIERLQGELDEAKEMAGIGGAAVMVLTSSLTTESVKRLRAYVDRHLGRKAT
jgi:hypothetical protein